MALVLSAMWLWGRVEGVINTSFGDKYQALPLPDKPHYQPSDVSLIVATIDTPSTFPESVRLWLKNKPKEIIVVTIERDLHHVQKLLAQVPESQGKVQVLTTPVANKREQLAVGIKVAQGSIMALVDDDAFWPKSTVLPFLLAGFEDPQVGCLQGMQSPYIPEEKRNADKITAWEIASIRMFDKNNRTQAVRYAADGGSVGIAGRTMLVRAAILKDVAFVNAMCNEVFAGNKLNTGDDCFITRWILTHGWRFHIQNAPEAEIFTLVPDNSKLLWQLIRWKRSTSQQCFIILFDKPGFRALFRAYPYNARKLVERFLSLAITVVHICAWVQTFFTAPVFGLVVMIWYIADMFNSYKSFVQKYPYCGKKIWAAVIVDQSYLVLDLIGWVTINKEGWMTRKGTK